MGVNSYSNQPISCYEGDGPLDIYPGDVPAPTEERVLVTRAGMAMPFRRLRPGGVQTSTRVFPHRSWSSSWYLTLSKGLLGDREQLRFGAFVLEIAAFHAYQERGLKS